MAINYSIKKNRLKKALLIGMIMDDEGVLHTKEDTSFHFMIMRAIDSAMDDTEWGRLNFSIDLPENMVYYVYASARNMDTIYDEKGSYKLDDVLTDENAPDLDRKAFFDEPYGERFVGKSDILLYNLKGRYLYLMIEIVGTGVGTLDKIRVQRNSDTFFPAFPEIYRQRGSFFHRLISVYSSIYNDFDDEIDRLPKLLDLDTCPAEILPIYASWLGIDISGDYLEESVCRNLVKEAYSLNRLKGTKACLERLLEIVLQEKPLILEQNTIQAYKEKGDIIGGNLVQESIYDVNILIRKLLNENERFQLEYLIDQFKPIRSRIHLIQLKETGILDSNIYLDMNAQISDEVFATLDDYQDINGTIVLK